jgi:hypothetical protein
MYALRRGPHRFLIYDGFFLKARKKEHKGIGHRSTERQNTGYRRQNTGEKRA